MTIGMMSFVLLHLILVMGILLFTWLLSRESFILAQQLHVHLPHRITMLLRATVFLPLVVLVYIVLFLLFNTIFS